MAEGDTGIMNILLELKQELKTSHDKIVSRLESKIDRFKNDIVKLVEVKVVDLKNDVYIELGTLTTRIENIEEVIKKSCASGGSANSQQQCDVNNKSVVIINMSQSPNENVAYNVDNLLNNGLHLPNIQPVSYVRSASRLITWQARCYHC